MLPRLFRRAVTLTPLEWRYLGIAIKELAFARLRFTTALSCQILQELQKPGLDEFHESWGRPIDLDRASWAIAAAAAWVPWRSDCLLQAMAANRWLRRRGHHPEFFLGVSKDAMGRFGAHAWLQCDGVPVTGGTGAEFETLITPTDLRMHTSRGSMPPSPPGVLR